MPETAVADAGSGWLNPDGVVVVKHFWRDEPPEVIGALTRARQKRFGETMLSFYTRSDMRAE